MSANRSACAKTGDNFGSYQNSRKNLFNAPDLYAVRSAQALPLYLYGNTAPLVYVNNPKAACTFAQNILFFANHNYPYFEPLAIHESRYAFWRLGGAPSYSSEAALDRLEALAPTAFSFVRDPLRRLISGFYSKIFTRSDPVFDDMRDDLTSRGGIDLSPGADKRKSILAFCEWLESYRDHPYGIDTHFRPQVYNLYPDADPEAQIVPITTLLKVEDTAAIQQFAQTFAPGLDTSRELYNPSLTLDYSEFYSADLAAMTRRIYARDYEALKY